MHYIHCNRVDVYTEAISVNILRALPLQMNRWQPSETLSTDLYWHTVASSTSAEWSVVYCALEHLRQYQPTNWVFLTDSRSALLFLPVSEPKTTKYGQFRFLNLNEYPKNFYRHAHTLPCQWIPSHVGIHRDDVADKTVTTAGSSSHLSAISLSRSDSRFIIKDPGRNLNRSLWNPVDYRSDALFQLDPEVELKLPGSNQSNPSISSLVWNYRSGFTSVRTVCVAFVQQM